MSTKKRAHEKATKAKRKEQSVLTEAEFIINGPRRDAYGPVEQSFKRIAQGWSAIFGCPVSARSVAQAMIWLKVCRDVNKPSRDSIVDIAGYAGLADKL